MCDDSELLIPDLKWDAASLKARNFWDLSFNFCAGVVLFFT